MARKHRRRTRKRGGSVMDKIGDGFKGLDDLRKRGQQRVMDAAKVTQESLEHVKRGYSDRVGQGGELPKLPQPPSSPPLSMDPVKKKQFSLESPYEQSIETNQPTKEIKGGLLGLGTWFGLGGRRLSHSSFINKMLRVRNKTKRNKAIRKYLKGGKRKTRKRKTKRRGGTNPQGGDNNLPTPQRTDAAPSEHERLEEVRRQVDRMQMRRIEAARAARRRALQAEANKPDHTFGGKRKRKNKTKKRRRRR